MITTESSLITKKKAKTYKLESRQSDTLTTDTTIRTKAKRLTQSLTNPASSGEANANIKTTSQSRIKANSSSTQSTTSTAASRWSLCSTSILTTSLLTNKLTYRSKRSGATSNTILKTPGGYEAIGSRPLKYLKDNDKRMKSK